VLEEAEEVEEEVVVSLVVDMMLVQPTLAEIGWAI